VLALRRILERESIVSPSADQLKDGSWWLSTYIRSYKNRPSGRLRSRSTFYHDCLDLTYFPHIMLRPSASRSFRRPESFTLCDEWPIVPAMNGTLFCNKCGARNAASAQFCGSCGAALQLSAAPPPSAIPAAAPVTTAYPVAQTGVRYGGFWIRLVAFLIDAILVRVVVHPVAAIFGLGGLAAGGLRQHDLGHGAASALLIFGSGVLAVLTIGASWLYEALMESSSYQATLGKMIFAMKVTDLYGNRISFARATGRHFAKWLSGLILGIGFIMVGLTERKQGLHDMIAGTLVRRY
jgi:uncharacterized RDD family membrane protein YckC